MRAGWSVGVFKPFASDPARRSSGERISTDADLLARSVNLEGGAHAACGQLFSAPLAPLASARAEGRRVRPAAALSQAKRIAKAHEITLVEGCGGWEVPLTPSQTTADFFVRLGAPVVIVAPTGLGTINHTLLTLRAVEQRGLRVLGVVLNRVSGGRLTEAERTNPAILGDFARVPIWGPLPYRKKLDHARLDRVPIEALHDMSEIADAILERLSSNI